MSEHVVVAGKWEVAESGGKWVTFPQIGDTGLTFVWDVRAKQDGASLGAVKWFGRWRTYAFFPKNDTLYEPTCLRDIAAFIDARMQDRKAQRRKVPTL